jgi:hypothetical protein
MTTMKMLYSAPKLVEYGTLDKLTQGAGGPNPDIDQFNNTVGNCTAESFTSGGSTFTRTSCDVIVVVPGS